MKSSAKEVIESIIEIAETRLDDYIKAAEYITEIPFEDKVFPKLYIELTEPTTIGQYANNVNLTLTFVDISVSRSNQTRQDYEIKSDMLQAASALIDDLQRQDVLINDSNQTYTPITYNGGEGHSGISFNIDFPIQKPCIVPGEFDPTYELLPATAEVNQGNTQEYTVNTTQILDGTILYWTTDAPSSAINPNSGTVTINSNTGTFDVITVEVDAETTYTISLRKNSESGTVVATSSITILAEELILDLYPLNAAYSFSRKLRGGYNGSAFRIRRDNDDAETDIGFNGNDVDTAAITTFVGSNSAYVVTAYDQQGSNDATQLIDSAQPRIVNAGVIETNHGKPAPFFDGVNDTLGFTSINVYAAFLVENVTITGGFGLLGSAVNSNIIGDLNSAAGRIRLNNTNYDYALTNSDNALTTLLRSVNDYSYFVNGASSINNPRTLAFNMELDAMMNRSNLFFYRGYLQEVLIATDDQTTNRVAIETNINDYYSIY